MEKKNSHLLYPERERERERFLQQVNSKQTIGNSGIYYIYQRLVASPHPKKNEGRLLLLLRSRPRHSLTHSKPQQEATAIIITHSLHCPPPPPPQLCTYSRIIIAVCWQCVCVCVCVPGLCVPSWHCGSLLGGREWGVRCEVRLGPTCRLAVCRLALSSWRRCVLPAPPPPPQCAN